jgi:hypothetical protein
MFNNIHHDVYLYNIYIFIVVLLELGKLFKLDLIHQYGAIISSEIFLKKGLTILSSFNNKIINDSNIELDDFLYIIKLCSEVDFFKKNKY